MMNRESLMNLMFNLENPFDFEHWCIRLAAGSFRHFISKCILSSKINHLQHHVKHKQSCACLSVYEHESQPGAHLHARRLVTKQR